MEAFENVVGRILEREGYWVRHSYKVRLKKHEKRKIHRPTMPALDIDLLAYKGLGNELLIVECKGYLGSVGVTSAAVEGKDRKWSSRFKLFNDSGWRNVIVGRLKKQLVNEGSCERNPTVYLCLAVGHIKSETDGAQLAGLFSHRGWQLFDKNWIVERLNRMSGSKIYEDDVSVIVTKLLAENAEGGSRTPTALRPQDPKSILCDSCPFRNPLKALEGEPDADK
jgi:hypothetical protein